MSMKLTLRSKTLTPETAQDALLKAILEKKPLSLWVSKNGDVVGITLQEAAGDEAVALTDEADTPLFPVCAAIRGRLTGNDGDPMLMADLPKAIKAAEAERIRFYTEREKEFGPSAWPHRAA